MKERVPKIKVTNETKSYIEDYLKAMQDKYAERLANKPPKPVRVKRAPKIKPVKMVNPYQKHIDKLLVVDRLLKEHQSFDSTAIVTDKEDEMRVLSAARYVETAVSLLLTLKKTPKA
jgi:hypothetical protein